jgi:hypothetical protein
MMRDCLCVRQGVQRQVGQQARARLPGAARQGQCGQCRAAMRPTQAAGSFSTFCQATQQGALPTKKPPAGLPLKYHLAFKHGHPGAPLKAPPSQMLRIQDAVRCSAVGLVRPQGLC